MGKSVVSVILFVFCCFVRNIHGIVLNVKITGPDTVIKTDAVSYSCTATCNNGTCSYSMIKPDDSTVTSSSLAWTVDRKTDATIICSVTDQGDKNKKTASKTVTVNYPPEVTINVNNVIGSLSCHADGKPKQFDYQWTQSVGGVVVHEGGFISTSSSITVPLEKIYSSTGNYTCMVTNGIKTGGTASVDNVKFQDKPVIPSYQSNYYVSKGRSLMIQFDVYAYPEVTLVNVIDGSENNISGKLAINTEHKKINVNFNGHPVQVLGQSVTATYREMTDSMFYNTMVIIGNVKGLLHRQIYINPRGPPDPPENVTIYDTTHESFKMALTSGFYNGANQTLHVEFKKTSSGNWIPGPSVELGPNSYVKKTDLYLAGLQPETSYIVRAYANNSYGSSNYTFSDVMTIEEPTNVGAIVGIVLGSLAGVVIVVVVVIFVCRRRTQINNAERKPSSNYQPQLQLDIIPNDRSSAIYVNEEIRTIPQAAQPPIQEEGLSENYMNTEFHQHPDKHNKQQPDPGVYVDNDVTDNSDGLALYLDLSSGKPEVNALEENYANLPDSMKPSEPEDLYLDMEGTQEVSTNSTRPTVPVGPTGELYEQFLIGQQSNIKAGNSNAAVTSKRQEPDEVLGESYENVAHLKKNKAVPISKPNSNHSTSAVSRTV